MFRLSNLKLGLKLPIMIALPVVIIVLASGALQLSQMSQAVDEEHKATYEGFVQGRKRALEWWLNEVQGEVVALRSSFAIQTAVTEFSQAWKAVDGDPQAQLRQSYIVDNPHPVGEKDVLENAGDGSGWSAVHQRHHGGLRAFLQSRGYYDLFLFDMDGNLIYSVFKEDDFGLNFETGKYKDSGLGEVFREGRSLAEGAFYMTSLAPYAPSAGAQAMFMSTPIFVDGQQAGVLAVQFPLDGIMRILSQSEQMGQTGFIYLVDQNGMSLTESPHEGGFSAYDVLPEREQIRAALAGEHQYFDPAVGVGGHDVISVADSVTIPNGERWGLVYEIDRSEAMAVVNKATTNALIELAVTSLLVVLASWLAVRGVVKRLERLAGHVEELADENYNEEITGRSIGDEVGFISKTLSNLQVRLQEGAAAKEREKEIQEGNAMVVRTLSNALMNLAKGDFRNKVLKFFPVEHKKLRYSINDAMTELSTVIESVRETAESIAQGAIEVSSSADDLSSRTESQAATLEQTAAALEQVTSSVKSANDNVLNVEHTVTQARGMAEESGTIVKETIDAMNGIEESSQKISNIISVIDDISFQTNLLALNAGVEAARAGEAGRGFAVVASEVRGLAQRSSEAALEIKALIETSGHQVGRGVQMVDKTGNALTQIVDQVKHISVLINEIAQSSQEQSTALTEINIGMSQLDQVTQSNAAMVEENTAAAHMLRSDSDRLAQFVGRFQTQNQRGEGEASQGTVAVDATATEIAPTDHIAAPASHAESEPKANDEDTGGQAQVASDPTSDVQPAKRANERWADF
ncbi:methyl-accepting chemotaxis protein [Tritonibacter scottomollicae]|uniref:methyl-accepting chemotaxis protein n=1 Tax=Tritonibacter scottomollicae TaxID=483013 RepID=UPI003AA97601